MARVHPAGESNRCKSQCSQHARLSSAPAAGVARAALPCHAHGAAARSPQSAV
jgi:hypothetical protein